MTKSSTYINFIESEFEAEDYALREDEICKAVARMIYERIVSEGEKSLQKA
jgi:hypothetical protein